jgi:beta-phosphoglucomutase family hydrolase
LTDSLRSQPRERIAAVIFDLDGVVTDTASVHAVAWKAVFDDYLSRAVSSGEPVRPLFDIIQDYPVYIDGKPRYEGVRGFLASREISLDYGSASDSPDAQTICGLGNRKDLLFTRLIAETGVRVFESTVGLIRALAEAGIHRGIASSSRNCENVLRVTGLEDVFEARVDGVLSADLRLRGKPYPDIFLRCAEELGVNPQDCVIIEDAISGVEAGRRGGFGLVVGVDRVGQGDALRMHGADVVVSDLIDVSPTILNRWWLPRSHRGAKALPSSR